jgi:hypothetical protein
MATTDGSVSSLILKHSDPESTQWTDSSVNPDKKATLFPLELPIFGILFLLFMMLC